MKKYSKSKGINYPVFALTAMSMLFCVSAEASGFRIKNVFGPLDNNAANNPVIQPDPANDPDPDGVIPDQTMQFGEVQRGSRKDDFLYGGLGTDIIVGSSGDNVMMGGPEHFNSFNRDRAFGGSRTDVFVWQPGDGSDRFEGGRGQDAVMFGLIAQDDDGDRVLFDAVDAIDPDTGNALGNFRVRRDEQSGLVLMRDGKFLPLVDVSAVPGTCEVIDRHTSVPNVPDTAASLDALDVDHLIRFRLRNGNLAVTVQTKDVEAVNCGGPSAGEVEVINLKVSPPQRIVLSDPTQVHLPPYIASRKLQRKLSQLLVDSDAEIAAGNGEVGVTVEDF